MSQEIENQDFDQNIGYTIQDKKELKQYTDYIQGLNCPDHANEEAFEKEKQALLKEYEKTIRMRSLSRKLLSDVNQDNYQGVKTALDFGAYINTKSEFGNTPLILAANRRNLKMVKLLLSHPEIYIQAQNKYGDTALKIAERNGDKEIVSVITKAKYMQVYREHYCHKSMNER